MWAVITSHGAVPMVMCRVLGLISFFIDLERVPWTPLSRISFTEKSLFYLAQPDSKCKAEKHACL